MFEKSSSKKLEFGVVGLEKIYVTIFLVISLIGGGVLGYILFSIEARKDMEQLIVFQPNLPTRVYDVKGRLVTELFQHQRKLVKIKDIPKPVIQVFLAIEDTSFYEHFGIDFMGVSRAMVENIRAWSFVQGGSTITQQLVKGIYTEGEKTVARKIYEGVLSLVVEKEFSKDEILEMYFNQIYLGHGSYGIASAAEFYFEKPVKELTWMEGVILAALPKAPHTYSPIRNFHKARQKNRITLNRLVEIGMITKEEASLAYKNFWQRYWPKVATTPASATIYGEKKNKAPYFTEYVRQELVRLFGEKDVYNLGLQVYTTLNLDHQKIAEEVLDENFKKQDEIAARSNNVVAGVDMQLYSLYQGMKIFLPLPHVVLEYDLAGDFREKFKRELLDNADLLSASFPAGGVNKITQEFYKSARDLRSNVTVQGAFISMEHKTGRISAMIGGREFKSSDQFNRAVQARRQPGSAFKPFVYGAALEDRAVHYASGFLDAPIMNFQQDGTLWAPSNYSEGFRGYVLMNKALAYSLNLVSVQIYDLIGPDKVIDFASRLMKVKPERFQPNPSLALGSSEVTPLELIQGYSIIANGGKDVIPHGILYVTDREGNILYDTEKEIYSYLNQKEFKGELQVIEPSIAFIVRKLLEGVVNYGTASKGVRTEGRFYYPVAGKTGTTSSWNDAWFAGFTPDMAAVLWMGLDIGSMTLGRHQSGGVVCAPLWGEIMRRIYLSEKRQPGYFNPRPPRGVKSIGVCTAMGRYPNPNCEVEQEVSISYFPSKIQKGGITKQVQEKLCDCNVQETKGFLQLLQEESSLSDEELGKTKKFKRNFGQGN